MDPRAVLEALREEAFLDGVSLHWDEAQAEFPPGGPEFLSDAAVAGNWGWSGLGEPVQESVLQTARQVRGDPALARLAWQGYWRLYCGPDMPDMRKFPPLENALGPRCGEFYLLLALAAVPLVYERHRRMGIPEAVTRETCLQIRSQCENYRRGNEGRWGIYQRQAHWHRHFVRGLLFRVGRFEYMGSQAARNLEVYRHRTSRRVVALIADRTPLTAEGFVARDPDMPQIWTATLEHAGEEVRGYPVSPRGFVVRRQVSLPFSEWDCVLKEGSSVVHTHIPAGGQMSPQAYTESLQQAPAFFRRFVPEHPVEAIMCQSWMFNTQFQEILPPESNLARLQRELYLFPVQSKPDSGLWFLFFMKDKFDPATAPRETSLQRAIADSIGSGRPWRAGGMFILPEELPRVGTQPYRSDWDSGGIPA